jgi:hypothetical protein
MSNPVSWPTATRRFDRDEWGLRSPPPRWIPVFLVDEDWWQRIVVIAKPFMLVNHVVRSDPGCYRELPKGVLTEGNIRIG